MTTSTAAKRPLVGWLIAIAGLAALLAVLLVFAPSVHLSFLGLVADLALTIAFLFMAIGKGASVFVRVLYAIGAVGWAILSISGFGVSLGTVLTIGVVLALAGTLLSGIVGIIQHVYSRAANLWYLLASIFVAIVLFNLLHGFLTGTLGVVVSALYGLLLLIAGVLIALRK